MQNVIGATSDGSPVPSVHDVENERRMRAEGGMQAFRRLPCAKTDARDVFTFGAGRVQRQRTAIARDEVPRVDQAADLELESFERGIDITHRCPSLALFAQNVPGFEGLADFNKDTAMSYLAVERETEFKMRREPVRSQRIAEVPQVFDHVLKVILDKMREHEPVMEFGAPAHQGPLIRVLPATGDQRAEQELWGEAHARVRRHCKGAQLDQAKAAAAGFGRVEFVDAELRAMRVASNVNEQVAKNPIHQPGEDELP